MNLKRDIYLTKVGLVHKTLDEQQGLLSLKDQVKDTCGKNIRRIGRFTQLALIAAKDCLKDASLPQQSGIYMSSPLGDIETVNQVIKQMVEHNMPPKPLQFINTVSNAPCFHLAQQIGVSGRNIYADNRPFAFESVLQLALSDLQAKRVPKAVVGLSHAITEPLSHHRERCRFDVDAPLAETAFFTLLETEKPETGHCFKLEYFALSVRFDEKIQGLFAGLDGPAMVINHADDTAMHERVCAALSKAEVLLEQAYVPSVIAHTEALVPNAIDSAFNDSLKSACIISIDHNDRLSIIQLLRA